MKKVIEKKGFIRALLVSVALSLINGTVFSQDIDTVRGEKGETWIFSLRYGPVTFTVDGRWEGYTSSGTFNSGTHSDDNIYIIRMWNGHPEYTDPTTNTITIETVNLVPPATGDGNKGRAYHITLENVHIDRSGMPSPVGEPGSFDPNNPSVGHGLNHSTNLVNYRNNYQYHKATGWLPFNAGDDTVEVEVTLVGDNTLIGEPGPNAALQYMSFDNQYYTDQGAETGTGKLTIKGEGTLTLIKDGVMNGGACLGAPQLGGGATNNVSNGEILIQSGTITATTGREGECFGSSAFAHYSCECGSYASAIGAGAGCRSGKITINGGTIVATSCGPAAAIGAGGGDTYVGADASDAITINGGNVTTYSYGNHLTHESGVGIGGGSAHRNGGGDATSIVITGGELHSYKWQWTGTTAEEYFAGDWVRGDIGGGNSNMRAAGGTNSKGGDANVTVTGGTVYAGNLGGGSASQPGAAGGDAVLNINSSGLLDLSGNIGGGNSVYYNGGNATITIISGTVNAGSIGGGSSIGDASASPAVPGNGNGGTASVTVQGGTLTVAGKIGGGNSVGSGAGGNASIYVTGGTLDCNSIGGGDSGTGLPGAVAAEPSTANPLGAGVYIAGSNSITVKSGYIGGGTNANNDIGKATAYINTTNSESTIQGQFIMSNNYSTTTDHCFFIMEAGTIDNTDLGAIGASHYPRKMNYGGAIYMNDNHGEVNISTGTITNCSGSSYGGAVYMSAGSFTLQNGATITGNSATSGGGVYVANGTVNITGSTTAIDGNQANYQGGGLFVGNGTITLDGASVSNNEMVYVSNGTFNGAGIYAGGGTLNILNNASISGNKKASSSTSRTLYGGGIYAASDINFTGGTIANNEANYGGGLYISGRSAVLTFSDGTFSGNYAASYGGGIYIYKGTKLIMKGSAVLTGNHAGYSGGGIYMDGELFVGDTDLPTFIQAYDNYKGSNTTNLNNIYLPSADKVVTLVSDISGKDPVTNQYNTRMGISVSTGNCPVVAVQDAANEPWLYALMSDIHSSGGAVFDDRHHYVAIHTRRDIDRFQDEYIYFWSCWTTEVTSNPGASHIRLTNGTYHIKTNRGLAWFTSMVNGLNGCTANRSLNAVLDNDVDMSAHLWVPIGAVTAYDNSSSTFTEGSVNYTGSFNGQGHVITGIDNGFLTGISRYGLFGAVGGNGTVTNTFVDAYSDYTSDDNVAYAIGGIVGELSDNAVVSCSEARGRVIAPICATNTYVGGIAGSMQGVSTIHSSMAMPDITAESGSGLTYAGGMVGRAYSGTRVLNGFSNGLHTGEGTYGGIAGCNDGVIRNCYARNASTLMGSGAGSADYSYTSSGSPLGSNGVFGATALVDGKYGFAHSDQQITGSNPYVTNGAISEDGELRGLMATLNAWVRDADNGWDEATQTNSNGYALWTRTMGSDINADYPVPQLTWKNDGEDFCCVGSQDGVFMEYNADLNDMIGDYNVIVPASMSFEEGQMPGVITNYSTYPWVVWSTNPHGGSYCIASGNYHQHSTTSTISLVVSFGSVGTVSFYSRCSSENVNWDYGYFSIDGVQQYKEGGTSSNAWTLRSFNVTPGMHTLSWIYYKDNVVHGGEDRYYIDDISFTGLPTLHDIYLYATTDEVEEDTEEGVQVFINEHVGVTQADGNVLNARVGVTFDNSDGGWLGGAPYDWHMFSSALTEAPMGVVYPTSLSGYHVYDNYSSYLTQGIPDEIYNDAVNNYMEAPATSWNTAAGSIGYFPTNTAFGDFDFYCYDEMTRHWINFKRQGHSGFYDHWHQNEDVNGMHHNIAYPNESEMVVGKGYMMAVTEPTMLMTDGVLNTGTVVNNTVSSTPGGGYDAPFEGVNLIGNPYQSYLDFDAFATENPGINTYYLLDADMQGYIAHVAGGSTPDPAEPYVVDYSAPQYIHPHQGFFVFVPSGTTSVTFTDAMRSATGGANSDFRGGHTVNRYPMVNMICSDSDGRNDFATVELDRPDAGGGRKVEGLRSGNASIWFRFDEADWQVAFTPVGTTTAPLRFHAHADGVYTLHWQPANADFHYLHLIDNVTGMDIDCLRESEYVFEGHTSDYLSRFKLVFDYTGVEEPEEDSPGAGSFAFMMGDELVVNGEGMLQLFDMNGRCLYSETLQGAQSTVRLPKVAAGMYVLRLTANGQVNVQKMVINQ